MEFCKFSDADVFAKVNVPCNGSCTSTLSREQGEVLGMITCTNVVPVWVIRSKFFESACFDEIDPCWHLELAGALEMGRVCGDEGFCAEFCVSVERKE